MANTNYSEVQDILRGIYRTQDKINSLPQYT